MEKQKSGKNGLWIYAVVLFTSAFVVLMITAFSQIKFNKNILYYQNRISEYEGQISSKESEKNKFLINLNSATDQNALLKKEVDQLTQQMKELQSKLDEMELVNSKLQENQNRMEGVNDSLSLAQLEYEQGHYAVSADILRDQIDTSMLSANAQQLYSDLSSKVKTKAAQELYNLGYDSYRKKQYSLAFTYFKKALTHISNEYFADDCYYLLAVSELKLGDTESAKIHFEVIITQYSSGTYYRDAQNYLKSLMK